MKNKNSKYWNDIFNILSFNLDKYKNTLEMYFRQFLENITTIARFSRMLNKKEKVILNNFFRSLFIDELIEWKESDFKIMKKILVKHGKLKER